MSKVIKRKNKEINNLKETVKMKEKNLTILKDYQNAKDEIIKDNYHVKQKIKEAQTDEEINNVIDSIIDANNKRLQND